MSKCDWCSHARRGITGRLVCPFLTCVLSQDDIREILKALTKGK